MNKEVKVEVVFGFWIRLEHPIFCFAGRAEGLLSGDVHTRCACSLCFLPPVSAVEHCDTVPPRGTLLVSGSLHTVTQTEQTSAPVPRIVLINYQQRLYPAAAGRQAKCKMELKRKRYALLPPPGVWCLASGQPNSPTWHEMLRRCQYICSVVWPFCFSCKYSSLT